MMPGVEANALSGLDAIPVELRHSVSVVIPNYNHGKFLRELLPLLLQQEECICDIVIVDDASTDDSCAVIRSFQQQSPRITLHRNVQNQGVIVSLNKALSLAQGRFVCFPSADNVLEPAFLQSSLAAFARFPDISMTCSDFYTFGDGVERRDVRTHLAEQPVFFSPEDLVRLGAEKNFFIGDLCVTLVIRKDRLDECAAHPTAIYDEDLEWHCDYIVNSMIALKYGAYYIPRVLAGFRLSARSYSGHQKLFVHRVRLYQKILSRINRLPADIRSKFVRSTAALIFPAVPFLCACLGDRKNLRYFLPRVCRMVNHRMRRWRAASARGPGSLRV